VSSDKTTEDQEESQVNDHTSYDTAVTFALILSLASIHQSTHSGNHKREVCSKAPLAQVMFRLPRLNVPMTMQASSKATGAAKKAKMYQKFR